MCDGNGICFIQCEDGNYNKKNKHFCINNCKLIKCPIENCPIELPQWLLEFYDGMCLDCCIKN